MNHLPNSLIPANDVARLRSLHHYQVLNTTAEDIFEAYVALAAQLFNLPISLISLVDEQKVFFKANTGLPGLEQVDRTDSLCSAAILQKDVLVYNNLAVEGCELVNPYLARAAGLQFYAGAALVMPDGNHIGSLCVIGREARSIDAGERTLLMTLAELTSATIELRYHYLHKGRAAEWEQIQQELQDLLHNEAAMARYLTARLGTIADNPTEQAAVQRRLQAVRTVLNDRLAEVNTE